MKFVIETDQCLSLCLYFFFPTALPSLSLVTRGLRNLTCPWGTCLLPLFALVFPCCSCLPLFALIALLCPSLPLLPLFCSCCNSNQLLVSLLLLSNSPLHCDFCKQRPNGLSLRMLSCRFHSLDKTQRVSPSKGRGAVLFDYDAITELLFDCDNNCLLHNHFVHLYLSI